MEVEPAPTNRPTAAEAESLGYTVDRHCYPWIAYKGPRFAPTEWWFLETPDSDGSEGS